MFFDRLLQRGTGGLESKQPGDFGRQSVFIGTEIGFDDGNDRPLDFRGSQLISDAGFHVLLTWIAANKAMEALTLSTDFDTTQVRRRNLQ